MANYACPYHLAVQHMTWLRLQPYFTEQLDMPLFPTASGMHPNKTVVVYTVEAIGDVSMQPLTSPKGLRLFGGHTPRVTGPKPSLQWASR